LRQLGSSRQKGLTYLSRKKKEEFLWPKKKKSGYETAFWGKVQRRGKRTLMPQERKRKRRKSTYLSKQERKIQRAEKHSLRKKGGLQQRAT